MIFLGGIGDLAIRELLDVQRDFLSAQGAYEISPAAESAFLELLHAMAGGLIGVGLNGLLLTHWGIRKGLDWAAFAVVVSVFCSESANTWGMYRLNSPFYVITGTYVLLIILAGVLYRISRKNEGS